MGNEYKDLELVRKWKDTRDPKYFREAYREMSGLIHSATLKAATGSNIPKSVFKLRAVQQFHDSLESFDEKRGVQLGSHVYKAVHEKSKRLNYSYADIARIPERSGTGVGIYHVGPFQETLEILQHRYGRDATDKEVAQEMGYSEKQIRALRKDITKDYSFSGDVEEMSAVDDDSLNLDLLNAIYYDLTPEQKKYYDFVTGQHGQQAIKKHTGAVDQNAIARRMGKTPKELQKIRGEVVQMMRKAN